MFLRNSWYVAAHAREIERENLLARVVLDEPLVLWRSRDNQVRAFQDRCPHRMVPLSAGRHLGDSIQCRYHGIRFGGDGACLHIPGQTQIPAVAQAKTWPAAERDGLIWVWIGEHSLADSRLIPRLPSAGWTTVLGYTHIRADYRLLSDNLLDLSHESYIHEGTIGNEQAQTIADFPVTVSTEEGHIVRAHRDMRSIKPPPFFAYALGSDGLMDRWQTAIWIAPSLNITDAGVMPTGRPPSEALHNIIVHLITPESASGSHYFWAACRNYHRDRAELDATIHGALVKTFDEDKEVLEMQQAGIDRTVDGAVPRFATLLDKAPMSARRMLAGLQRQQAADGTFVPAAADMAAILRIS
jgi:vanillate O-demethylase monooxygenase subunit